MVFSRIHVQQKEVNWFHEIFIFPYRVKYLNQFLSRYPNYLSGTAYVMSKSTALTLYEASLQTPIFHMEDIYLTGNDGPLKSPKMVPMVPYGT